MKTTYPKRFKAKSKKFEEIIEGTLTTDGYNYGISFMNRVDTALSHHDGYTIDVSTLQWLCANCNTWNTNNDLGCKHCKLKLGR